MPIWQLSYDKFCIFQIKEEKKGDLLLIIFPILGNNKLYSNLQGLAQLICVGFNLHIL